MKSSKFLLFTNRASFNIHSFPPNISTFLPMPIQFGKIQTLRVSARFEFGLELTDNYDKVLLPSIELEGQRIRVGDQIKVFIYGDRAGKLAATLKLPHALPGSVAAFPIYEIAEKSVWLDWGPHFHLRVSPDDICMPIHEGMLLPVKVLADIGQMRFKGTNLIDDYLKPAEDLEVGQKVKFLVYRSSPLGMVLVVEQKFHGMIFESDLQKKLKIGQTHQGYIKKVREDGKLDISLVPQGYENAIDEITMVLWRKLEASPYGFLPYHDKTDPALIQAEFGLSKKNFKKALGNLFKSGRAEKADGGFRKKENGKD